ncbi:hypothetical protein [Nocardia sp. CY41]|uniref:hypothetical protein n=1 Tax=Nocardia sp. CY41 TaxID=2608686 RepID=UPI00135853E8|nr:hypothetical protein [Nocardia sp. CY41]
MVKHSAAYEAYVTQLLATPPDSADHRMAEVVAAMRDDDALLTLLFEIYTEDPVNTREFALAAHLLSLLFGSAVTA